MRVALAQLNPVSGDIDGNAEKICAAIAEATRQGADLVIAPEMVLPGYCIGDLIENVDFLAANERAIHRIAQASLGITSIVGFIDYNLHQQNDNGTVRKDNAAAVVRDGVVLQRARKSLLPNYRYFDDKRFFTPAETREPVDIPTASGAVRIGVSICEDMWDDFYEIKPLPELAAKGASVLLNLNASPFYPGKRHQRDALIRRHLAQVNRPLVYVNTVGAADNGKNVIAFDGESPVVRRARPPDRDRAAVRGRAPGGRSRRRCGPPRGRGAAADRSRARGLRRVGHGTPRLHAEEPLHRDRRAGLGRD